MRDEESKIYVSILYQLKKKHINLYIDDLGLSVTKDHRHEKIVAMSFPSRLNPSSYGMSGLSCYTGLATK